MKKIIFSFMALVGAVSLANAQTYDGYVGINTSTPAATLDIKGAPTNTAKFDGVIAPRITGDQLGAKTYTAAQTGALVYATAAAAAPAGQVINVTGAGYYWFDGTVWVKVATGTGGAYVEPWYNVATNTGATANTQNIYQMGNVGVGTNSIDGRLHVYTNGFSGTVVPYRSNIKSEVKTTSSNGYYLFNAVGGSTLTLGSVVGLNVDLTSSAAINDYGVYINGEDKNYFSNKIGINTTAPTNLLHVKATTDPLRLEGLQTGATTDQILTVDATGVVKQQTATSVAAATEPWYNVATGAGATANTQNIYQMGNVGINNPAPATKLDILSTTNGAIKIVDGTQGEGKRLTSDANGVGTWQMPYGGTYNSTILVTGGVTGATVLYGNSITVPMGVYIGTFYTTGSTPTSASNYYLGMEMDVVSGTVTSSKNNYYFSDFSSYDHWSFSATNHIIIMIVTSTTAVVRFKTFHGTSGATFDIAGPGNSAFGYNFYKIN